MLEKLLWMGFGAALFFILQVIARIREIHKHRLKLDQYLERSIWDE